MQGGYEFTSVYDQVGTARAIYYARYVGGCRWQSELGLANRILLNCAHSTTFSAANRILTFSAMWCSSLMAVSSVSMMGGRLAGVMTGGLAPVPCTNSKIRPAQHDGFVLSLQSTTDCLRGAGEQWTLHVARRVSRFQK